MVRFVVLRKFSLCVITLQCVTNFLYIDFIVNYFYVHNVHFLFIVYYLYQQMHTHTHIYIYIYIYIKILNYITNAPTCFSASTPSSWSFDIVFAKVIKY